VTSLVAVAVVAADAATHSRWPLHGSGCCCKHKLHGGILFQGDNFHGEETFVAPLVAATTRPRWLLRSQSSCYAEYAAAKPIRKMYIFQLYSTPPV